MKSRIKRRQLSIQNQLPNVLDVLSVSIEAGLSFDSALLKVVERFNGPLIDELAQVYREIQMGKPRREALVSLSQRSNVPELQTFVSAVAQSETFGTPMKKRADFPVAAAAGQPQTARAGEGHEGPGKNDASHGRLYFSGHVHYPAWGLP